MSSKTFIKDILAFGIAILLLTTGTVSSAETTQNLLAEEPTPTRYFFPTPTRLPSRPVYQVPQNNGLFLQKESPKNDPEDVPHESSSSEQIPFQAPQINIPKIPANSNGVLNWVLNAKNIQILQTSTEKPLAALKTAALAIKTYDQRLENTVSSFIQHVYRQIGFIP
jgi:hypothetical protein